jgi:hypothetical protein
VTCEAIIANDIATFQNSKSSVRGFTSTEVNLTATQIAALKESIKADIKSMMKNASEDVGAGLAALQSGSEQNVRLQANIDSSITTNVTNTTIQKAFTSGSSTQNSTLTIGGPTCKSINVNNIHVDQNILLDVAANSLVKQVLQTVQDSTIDSDLSAKADLKGENTATGLGTIIKKFGDAISKILSSAAIIPVVIVIAVLLFLPMIIKALKGNGSKQIMMPPGQQQMMPPGQQQMMPFGQQQMMPFGQQQMMPFGQQQMMPPGQQQMMPLDQQQMMPPSQQQNWNPQSQQWMP